MANLRKFIKSIKEAFDPRANLVAFSEMQEEERENYIKSLSTSDLKSRSDEQRLEAMVRKQLKEEFPNIEKSKSYELLVDAVMHNLKKKQLQAEDSLDIE
jgi:RNA-splicing ligase RtcB